MARRYLTTSQRAILRCMAQNNGRATIIGGVRRSRFSPGYARIFKQAMHCMLHNRWITSKGQNERSSYAWTEEGKLAHERGWYVPKKRTAHWMDEKPEPAGGEHEAERAGGGGGA